MSLTTIQIDGVDRQAYASLPQANTYLAADPIRGAAWAALADDSEGHLFGRVNSAARPVALGRATDNHIPRNGISAQRTHFSGRSDSRQRDTLGVGKCNHPAGRDHRLDPAGGGQGDGPLNTQSASGAGGD